MSVHKNDFPTALSELNRINETRNIPNALLFTGNPGSGRKQAAFRFAKGINCTAGAATGSFCNNCRSCKKIDANQHPDIIVVAPLDPRKAITISQVRQITAQTGTRPHEAAFRMVLITDADRMNTQAQNGLLKELEEPPEKTFFILMAKDRSALLPTIISRCRSLRFPPLSGPALAGYLCDQYPIDAQWAGIAAATAGIDQNLATTLVHPADDNLSKDPKTGKASGIDWYSTRPWLIQQLCDLISGSASQKIQTALGLSGFLSQDSDRVMPGLAVMRTFFRDLFVFRHAPEKILNRDCSDRFQKLAPDIRDNDALFWMDELHETEKRLASNSAIRMTLDRFFLKLIHI
jgi:DNA polymerase III subunit delta'